MTNGPLLFISVFICVRQSMESTPSCQDIFALGDSLMCTTCGAEINTRCRINLLDENPAVIAPYLEILRTTSLLACFYSDASYLNPESHAIAICKPGSMCGSVRSGDGYIRGCVSHNSAHTQKCSEDFCNHSFDSTDLDMVNIILLKYVTSPTSTSTTTTATTTRTTTQPSTTKTTTPPITTSATTETRPKSRTTIPSTTPTTRSSLTSAITTTTVIKTTTENHNTKVTARACEGNPSIVCHSENPFCPFFDGVTGICSTLITESSLNFFGRCALYCNKCQAFCDVMAAKLITTTTTTTTTTTPQRTTMLSATSSDGVQFKTCRENQKFVCYNRPEFCSIVNKMTGMCTRNPMVDSIEFFHRCSLYCNRCEEYCDIVATFLTTISKPSEHGTNPTPTEHSVKTTGQAVRFDAGGPSIHRQPPTTATEPPTTAGANKSPPLVNSNGAKGLPELQPEIHSDIQPSLSSISPATTPTPAEGYGVIVLGRR